MSIVTPPTLILLKHLTEFISQQDGSKTLRQLQPQLVEYIRQHSPTPYTAQELSNIVTKAQHGARSFRSANNVAEQTAANYKQLMDRVAAVRGQAARKDKLLKDNANIVRAFKTKKAPKPSKRTTAEMKLAEASAELRSRNSVTRAEVKEAESEDKAKKREVQQAEKAVRQAKTASKAELKRLQAEQCRAREEELKMRQTDVRAMQVLDLKAKQIDLEKGRQEEAVRRKRIDERLEKALDLIIAKEGGDNSKQREEVEEMDSDKENDEPASGWQVR